ncbi:MAG: chemotaxis protein [Syntrophomonadaceae bacterium]|nr:chemotaxis protein [Syntrophomonadaceae bacterium]
MDNNMDARLTDEEILECYNQISKYYHDLIPVENTILVFDQEKYLGYYAGKEAFNPEEFIGKPLPSESSVPTVLKTGEKLAFKRIDTEWAGKSFKSVTAPIKNQEGNTIGCISLLLSLEGQAKLEKVADTITSSSDKLSSSSEEISSSAAYLSNNIIEVLNNTEEIVELIQKTNNILDFVNEVASNSRLLGLNAAIEAARAGDAGKGFSVVADEIRKLAEKSAQSVKDTKVILSSISDKADILLKKINEVSKKAETQAAVTEEISASILELSTTSSQIKDLANLI